VDLWRSPCQRGRPVVAWSDLVVTAVMAR